MNIADLNTDCLVGCLRYLNIEDLLNVADTNRKLRHAARLVFQRMHGHRLVRFDQIFEFNYLRYYKYSFTDTTLNIYQLKLCCQFLRCFGDLVPEIEFIFCHGEYHEHIPHEWEHQLIEYINHYCAESLNRIKFDGNLFNYINGDLSKLTKSFVRVEKLTSHIFFPTKNNFHELFPNLRELVLENINIPSSKLHGGDIFLYNDFMAKKFPNLEHLTINLESKFRYEKENFAIALRLSPKIKSLKGNVWFEILFKRNLFIDPWKPKRHFKHLERLDLVVNLDEKPGVIEILERRTSDDLCFKMLKELNIEFLDQNLDDTDTEWTFPFKCDQLRSLTLSSSKCKLNQFTKLLRKHPSVRKLEIKYNATKMSSEDCSTISQAFPMLEEIVFKMLPDDIGGFVKMFRSLKCFKYYTQPADSIVVTDQLLRSLIGWSVTNFILDRNRDVLRLIEGQRIIIDGVNSNFVSRLTQLVTNNR